MMFLKKYHHSSSLFSSTGIKSIAQIAFQKQVSHQANESSNKNPLSFHEEKKLFILSLFLKKYYQL
jgi:hypothetical protein